MTTRRVRIVVIVRCPLCGAWMTSDGQTAHYGSVHTSEPPAGYQSERQALGETVRVMGGELTGPDGCPVVDAVVDAAVAGADALVSGAEVVANLFPDMAEELLRELGWRRLAGQVVQLGFEIYES